MPVLLTWDSKEDKFYGVDPLDECVEISVDSAKTDELIASPGSSLEVPWPELKK